MQSRIVAVRSALIDGLSDLPGLDGVEVNFAYRAGINARERIWTQGSRMNQNPASMRAGRNFRDEGGGFELVVLVEGVGESAEWTSERALEIGLLVEEYIADRKNNELGVTGLQTFYVNGELTLTEMFNDSGHLAELIYPVRYSARLT